MPGRAPLAAVVLSLAVALAGEASGQGSNAARGTVVGVVVDTAGRPYRGASVVLNDGTPRVTAGDGRFAFANVAQGMHEVEVFAIGMKPNLTRIEVTAGQRVELRVRFEPLQALPTVRVVASRWQRRMIDELAARMAKGHGQFRDSTVLANRMSWEAAIAGLRRGLHVEYAGRSPSIRNLVFGSGSRGCRAAVYVDGYRVEASRLHMYSPQDVAMMEVYDMGELVPFHFGDHCGVVVLWTKDVMP